MAKTIPTCNLLVDSDNTHCNQRQGSHIELSIRPSYASHGETYWIQNRPLLWSESEEREEGGTYSTPAENMASCLFLQYFTYSESRIVWGAGGGHQDVCTYEHERTNFLSRSCLPPPAFRLPPFTVKPPDNTNSDRVKPALPCEEEIM